MFNGRQLHNWINNIHERALQIIYQEYTTSFNYLLAIDNSLTIHFGDLQKLVTESIKSGIAMEIMKNIFQMEEKPYKVQNIC